MDERILYRKRGQNLQMPEGATLTIAPEGWLALYEVPASRHG